MGAALLVSALGMELLAELRQELVDHGLLIGDLSPESREQLAQGRLVYRAVGIAGQTAVGAGDRASPTGAVGATAAPPAGWGEPQTSISLISMVLCPWFESTRIIT